MKPKKMAGYTEIDAEKIEKAAQMMKAVAHPVRLSILGYLSDGEDLTVTQIHELARIEQSTASHNLGILKDKGILMSRRIGKNTLYFLKNKNFKELIGCIHKCACID
ncbi:MAG: metalloregulator ArsR/SmtB family transcription factor [Bacteroidales bacterium]|nr:metalloregulator ArsR/SmtB family transcription factor [Bacteroidales bacterium]